MLITRKQITRAFPQPAEPSIVRKGGSVITHQPQAREIGESILRAGGNAFDAFVATAVAVNVLAEGTSSLAGPMGVLSYHAADGEIMYLDADFNDPLDPGGCDTMDHRKPGKGILVPGAPAGLEALAIRYGRLPFSELLQPSIALAENGFPVSRIMAGFIAKYAKLLKKTEYGRNTFFQGDKPLKAGAIIRQPEVAEFLRKLAKEGSAYVYTGDWGERFLSIVSANGGCLTAADLSNYSAKWCVPWTTTYRGYRLHSSSSHSYGGPWVLLALKTLEHTTLSQEPRYWEDADSLELMLRITRQVWSEPAIFDYRVLDDPKAVESLFTVEYARSIWERVRDKLPDNFMGLAGSHSYHIIATDDEGNIAAGTISIYSDPWADGLFVEGIPLTSAGVVPWNTKPGERRLSPLSIHLALQDGQPRIAVGSFSNSIVEASFQFLVKLIDYQMSVRDTVSTPRFGTFSPQSTWRKILMKFDTNWLDPRVERSIVGKLKARGIKVKQKGLIDTGLGVAMRLEPDGTVEGIPAPVPYLRNPFNS